MFLKQIYMLIINNNKKASKSIGKYYLTSQPIEENRGLKNIKIKDDGKRERKEEQFKQKIQNNLLKLIVTKSVIKIKGIIPLN